MPAPRRPLLLACQSTMAAATAAVLCLPAMSVVALDIVPSVPGVEATPSVLAPPTTLRGERAPARAVVATRPVRPRVTEVDLQAREVERPAPRSTVLTRPIEVAGYATVGLTWSDDSVVGEDDLAISLSTSTKSRWTDFEPMSFDPDHEPAPGSPEARRTVRPGTDALVVGEVDAVRVKVRALRGELPADLELSVVDPGVDRELRRVSSPVSTSGAPAAPAGAAATSAAVLSAATAPRPTIRTRSDWGANESLRDKGSLRYGTIKAGFVHHTVNSNGYSRDQVPSIIRGIYAYHTQSRGWSDIGYNFLVDRFGTIWEGRYGGVARPVVGAHTLGYNDYSFAMSAIGNFDVTGAPSAMLDAYGRLFAWKLSLHGVDASSTRQRVGSRYFPAISGHRDAGQTACPGRYLYARIPDIRTRAAKIQKGGTTAPADSPDPAKSPMTNLSGVHWPDVASRRSGELTINRTGGQVRFHPSLTAGRQWGGKDLIAAAGDMTGDGIGDLVVRQQAGSAPLLHAGKGDGTYAATPVRDYPSLTETTEIVGVGDFDGDGNDDLVARTTADRLLLYPGRSGPGLRSPRLLARDWGYDLTAAGGDIDRDGRADLVARKDGRLSLVRGLADRVAPAIELGGVWAGYDTISGGHDLSGDGQDDLLVRVRRTKLSYIVPGNGEGGFRRRLGPFSDFKAMGWLAVNGQLAKGKARDVVGVNAETGALKVFANTGRQNLGRTVVPGVSLRGTDTVLSVGDWNKDGRGDLMYREANTGRLMFLANRGKDSYADAVVAGTGFADVTGLVAAGDVSGDGKADLMGLNANGVARVYKGDGSRGFDGSFAAARGTAAPAGKHQGVVVRRTDGSVWLWRLRSGGGTMSSTKIGADASGYDWFLALGDLDGDGRQDVLARAKANGWLWLLPVTVNGFGPRRFVSDEVRDHDLAAG